MKSIVIFATRHGNTQQVAEAIADGLRPYMQVDLIAVDDAPATLAGNADLVVIGGPTEAHGMTPVVKEFLDGLSGDALKGVPAAAFDTRLDWPQWASGSAAGGINARLRKLGADMIMPQASFIVEGKDPVLKPGEVERAVAWGDNLGRALVAETAAVR